MSAEEGKNETDNSAIELISPGFYSTVQDLGRNGWTHLGVSPGGAADAQALRIGNRLVGNDERAAGIEMTFTGGRYRFHREAWIAITGSECTVQVDDSTVAQWTSFRIEEGRTLSIGSMTSGARAYLCVHGGIDVPLLLGSRSTFTSGGWGGFAGRELQSGDRLSIGDQTSQGPGFRRAGLLMRAYYRAADETLLRVTRGPQWNDFATESQGVFLSGAFQVTPEADRKGLRLKGPVLVGRKGALDAEMVTEGVCAGAIQVPPSGNPLLLFCEQQTTGGYPKIANVIRADLFRLGQLRPGDKIRFQEVSMEEAWQINREREELCRRPLI